MWNALFFYDASSWALLYMWYQASITDKKNYSFQWNNMLCNKMQRPVFEASVTLSSSLVVLAWHLYVANKKFPLGCWKRNKESHTLYCRVKILGLSKEQSSPLNHIHWNWQQPSSYPRPADLWGHHSAHKSLFPLYFLGQRDYKLYTPDRLKWPAHLKEQIVDGSLHFKSEAVAGIILTKGELVINAENGDPRESSAWLGCLLVLLTTLQDSDLQLLQLCPATMEMVARWICSDIILGWHCQSF